MKIRSRVLPRRLVDCLSYLFAVLFPAVFIFEIIIVLPAFHEPGGFLHTYTLVFSIFMLHNTMANWLGCIMIDTSVDFQAIQPPSDDDDDQRQNWRHCDICDKLAPPRSWHCKVCRSCILKSDHHCVFTGCCIGQRNYRFFLYFVFYLLIGSTYALIYNSIYMWVLKASVFWNWAAVIKIFCPIFLLIHGDSYTNMCLMCYYLNIFAFIYSLLMVYYHGSNAIHGRVSSERSKQINYDLGIYENFKHIFGEQMHLSWISPLIKSKLPKESYEQRQQINKSK